MSMRVVKLGDLLNETQMKRVEEIVKDIGARRCDVKELRAYLRTQSESLESHGVLPDYLYYWLCNQFQLMG